jgi:hypothetical protein
MVVVLWAAFLAAVVVGSCFGVRTYQAERAAVAARRPTVAVLFQSGPTGYGQARARWRAPDGHWRSGLLTWRAAPSIWGAATGNHVRVWVIRVGD